MIRLLVKLGTWLDKRFPERLVVNKAEYDALLNRIDLLEKSAVHTDAVKEVIRHVELVKQDVQALKLGLGMSKMTAGNYEAVLNGEAVEERSL